MILHAASSCFLHYSTCLAHVLMSDILAHYFIYNSLQLEALFTPSLSFPTKHPVLKNAHWLMHSSSTILDSANSGGHPKMKPMMEIMRNTWNVYHRTVSDLLVRFLLCKIESVIGQSLVIACEVEDDSPQNLGDQKSTIPEPSSNSLKDSEAFFWSRSSQSLFMYCTYIYMYIDIYIYICPTISSK